jgi:Protein of unknown function (DUF3617)
MRIRTFLGLTGALTFVGAVVAQTVNLRPGQYEMTVELNMPGGQKMAPIKQTDCITADDLKDFTKAFQDPDFAKTCKVSGYTATASKVTFNTDCTEDGQRMTGKTEMNFTSESFTGLTTTKDGDGNVITMKMSGKRIGECPK